MDRKQLPYVTVPRVLTPRQCADIRAFSTPLLEREAHHLHTCYLDDCPAWLTDVLERLRKVNPWRIRVTTCEKPVVVRYRYGSISELHVDYRPQTGDYTKFSMLVMLSQPKEYAGGALQVTDYERPRRFAQGTGIVFPAIFPHEVKRVTGGERWVLASWAHGPAFR
jgi:predicted 2-oxoglutarate/Fe(II)-dependent dioxygenase YbiX